MGVVSRLRLGPRTALIGTLRGVRSRVERLAANVERGCRGLAAADLIARIQAVLLGSVGRHVRCRAGAVHRSTVTARVQTTKLLNLIPTQHVSAVIRDRLA